MRDRRDEAQFIAMHVHPRFRHTFLFRAALALSLTLWSVVLCATAMAQNAGEDGCPLSISSASDAPKEVVLSPPPGEYRMPCGDIALVRADCSSAPASLPEWSGDAAGAARTVAVSTNGPTRLQASFPGVSASGDADSFAAPDKGALHAFLGSGGLYGWFSVNRHKAHTGAGITQLASVDEPFCPVFLRPNLNFEHIMNGCRDDQWRAQDTPRTDPMQVLVLSPSRVEVRWPAQSATWKLDCVMRYSFTGRNAINMEFEMTPRSNEAPRGFLLFMWASYMQMVRGRTLHFPGVRDGVAGWVFFGKEGESGTVAGQGQLPLQWDNDAGAMNLNTAEGVCFTEPVYYGLLDGDQNMDTSDDAMAFIMMFDQPESTRFAVWNWGEGPRGSAWDWQFVVRSPEVGRTYRHHARLVFKRFAGGDDVLAEYRHWSEGGGGAVQEAPLPLEAFPVILPPGQDRQDPIQLGDALRADDPSRALRLYREGLRREASRPLAVNRINDVYMTRGDPAGRIAFWTSVTKEQPTDSCAWFELGLALEANGGIDQAVAAHREALRLDPKLQRAKLRLGGLTAGAGDVGGGLQLVDEAAGTAPDLVMAAAEVCTGAAAARRSAGDAAGAVLLLRRARTLSPTDLRWRVALGGALEAAGDDEGALGEYRGVLAAAPESPHSSNRIDTIYQRRNDAAARAAEWNSLVAVCPQAATPQYHLGLAMEASGDTGAAETAYREAMRLRPEWQEPKLALGALLASRGGVEEGLSLLDQAVSAGPELGGAAAAACGRAAKARLSVGDTASALVLLKRARTLSPADLSHRVALGEALEAAGDEAAALEEYRAVVKEVPESPHSGGRIDAILLRRGDSAARMAEWRAFSSAHPGAAMPQFYLGLAMEASGDIGAAETAYGEAVRLRPEWQEPKIALGAALASRGCAGEGFQLMDQAVAVRPELAGDAAAACGRAAQARLSAGDTAGALTLLKRARSLSPTDLRYRVALGGVFEAAGDDAAALEEYRAVVDEVPESPHCCGRIDAILDRRGDAAARAAEWRRTVEMHPGAAWPRVYLGLSLEAAGDAAAAEAEYRAALSRNASVDGESVLLRRLRQPEGNPP